MINKNNKILKRLLIAILAINLFFIFCLVFMEHKKVDCHGNVTLCEAVSYFEETQNTILTYIVGAELRLDLFYAIYFTAFFILLLLTLSPLIIPPPYFHYSYIKELYSKGILNPKIY